MVEIYQVNLNPLNIPYVLENIFDYLTVWNLKKCRLVSKTWHEEATPLLQKKCKISIKTQDHLVQLQTLDNLGSFCQSFDISHDLSLNNQSVASFFEKFSPIIKSLDLSCHQEYSSWWIHQIFPNLSNLEELCLNGRSLFLQEETSVADLTPDLFSRLKFLFIYDSSYELEGPLRYRIWVENIFHILLAACNLSRLFFAPFLETRARTFFSLITSEASVHRNISHLHINHLSVTGPDLLKSLLQKQFPLTYLHLVLTNALRKEDLQLFLYKTRDTLRELTLTFTEGVTCSQFHPIQPLDNLTKLSLIGYEGALITSSAKNLQLFVISLPEVEDQLKLEETGSGIEGNKGLKLLNRELKELEIYDSKGKYCSEILKIVYMHFHNLTSLKMNNVDNFILRLVYINLPQLSQLQICFHKFYGVTSLRVDSGLSGIPEYFQDDCLLDCLDQRDIQHARILPWIGSLKNLWLLELELGHITDFGVILGIVHCPKLKKLILKNCDCVYDDSTEMMTDRSLQAICDLDLTYLKLDGYVDCFSENALEIAKKRMDGVEAYFT